jgi:RNA recognition motif-containing protein
MAIITYKVSDTITGKVMFILILHPDLTHLTTKKTGHERNDPMNFYIGNLSTSVTEEDLRKAFGSFGSVSDVKIIKDRFSGMSKGFGFIEMPDNSEADKATKALNNKEMKGQRIKITQQDERSKKRQQKKKRF